MASPRGRLGDPWRDIIRMNNKAIGLADEGDKLIGDLEERIGETVAKYPRLRASRRCS